MIRSAKRCLRKTIGRARVTYDELLTTVTEVEMILNSRSLSYVSTEDIEEPLTPSHLLVGHRLLSLPDPSHACGEYTIDVSQETLSKRERYLGKIMEHFWDRIFASTKRMPLLQYGCQVINAPAWIESR